MNKKLLILPIALVAFSVFGLACATSAATQSTPVATTVPTPIPTEEPTPSSGGLTQEQLAELQNELNANVEKWQQSGVQSYTVEFRVNCFCPIDITAPVKITVMDTNTIDSLIHVESGEPVTQNLDMYITVGGMFDMIQDAIGSNVANLTVSYHPELGYPTEVFIDHDFMIADEERGFMASNLEPIEDPTMEEIQSQLDSSRELWESNGPESYEIEYSRICFCPEDIRAPVVVAVSNGTIESRTYAEGGNPVGAALQDLFIDVPGLFDIVQDAIDQDAAKLRVSYDAELGYPTSIDIDYNTMMADEELGFSVNSFTAK